LIVSNDRRAVHDQSISAQASIAQGLLVAHFARQDGA
jgi:hypothetical protein